MSFRLIASVVLFMTASVMGGSCLGDEENSRFGIAVPPLVVPFPDVFADAGEGFKFASCHSADSDAGGPLDAFLMFLPRQVLSRNPKFDAVFFWVGSDEDGR